MRSYLYFLFNWCRGRHPLLREGQRAMCGSWFSPTRGLREVIGGFGGGGAFTCRGLSCLVHPSPTALVCSGKGWVCCMQPCPQITCCEIGRLLTDSPMISLQKFRFLVITYKRAFYVCQ